MRWRCALSRLTPMAGRMDANGMLTNKTCMAADLRRSTQESGLTGRVRGTGEFQPLNGPWPGICATPKAAGTPRARLLAYERALYRDADLGHGLRAHRATGRLRRIALLVVGPAAESLHFLVLDR